MPDTQPYAGQWKQEDGSGLCPTCRNVHPEICSSSFHREQELHINTGYGTLRISRWLLDLWNKYGWPTEEVLQQMHAEQEGRDV